MISKIENKLDIGSRVLLLAHGHTGNNVFCTPTVRFLKKFYPETTFDIVALTKASSEVFENNPDINSIYVLDSKRAVKKLARNYTTVICLNPKSENLLDGTTVNIMNVPPLPTGIHHADHMLNQIASYTNCDLHESDRQYQIQANTAMIESILIENKIEKDEILIGMHLGCARTAIHGWKFFYKNRASHQKLWPLDKYITLGKMLLEVNPNLRIFITGTKNEIFLGKQFEKEVPRTINLIGETSVSDIVGILNKSNLFLTQDCGVLHVASASTVALIALFGPTNPIATGPYPMWLNRCVIKKDSMLDIEPDEVAELAKQILNASLH